MATQVKLTIKMGETIGDVVQSAGSAEAQSDTMSLNIDVTNMTQREALVMVERLEYAIKNGNWPRT